MVATVFWGFEDISLPPFLLFQLITSVRREAKSGMFSRLLFPMSEMLSDGSVEPTPSACRKDTSSTQAAL